MVNLKKLIIFIIYLCSAIIAGIALYAILAEEERTLDVEFIIEKTSVPESLLEKLYEKESINQSTEMAVVYFMNPFTCPVCMLEIEEFSALMKEDFIDFSYTEIFAFNSENQILINNFLLAGNYSHEYINKFSGEHQEFLSSYNLRSNLVGQIVVIDLNQMIVVSRAILENAAPTSHESKVDFIKMLKSNI